MPIASIIRPSVIYAITDDKTVNTAEIGQKKLQKAHHFEENCVLKLHILYFVRNRSKNDRG